MFDIHFYPERAGCDEILELALQTVCADPSNSGVGPAVHALLQAFAHLRVLETHDDEFIDGKEAEELFYQTYVNVYRRAHTDRVRRSDYAHILRTYEDTAEDRDDIKSGSSARLPWAATPRGRSSPVVSSARWQLC